LPINAILNQQPDLGAPLTPAGCLLIPCICGAPGLAQPLIRRAGICALYCGFTTSRVNCPGRQLYIHLRQAVLKEMWYILQSSMSIAKTFQSWDD